VAEWLRRGLQILLFQFDSGRGLQKISCFIFLKKVCCSYSSVAQLVEQLTVNQLVAGSSPARGAKPKNVKINLMTGSLACFIQVGSIS
jgi:hypothetical protein